MQQSTPNQATKLAPTCWMISSLSRGRSLFWPHSLRGGGGTAEALHLTVHLELSVGSSTELYEHIQKGRGGEGRGGEGWGLQSVHLDGWHGNYVYSYECMHTHLGSALCGMDVELEIVIIIRTSSLFLGSEVALFLSLTESRV